MSRPDLAKASGVPYPTLSGIENGDQANSTSLPELASALGVNIHWLKTGKGPMDAAEPQADWADVRGYRQGVALGPGAALDEYAEAHKLKFRSTSLRRKGLHAESLAVYYGSGDSMEPRIHDGDAILFDTSDTTPKDDAIFVVEYDGDIMAKRLLKLGDQWFLASDNGDDPRWRKPVPIDPDKGFQVVGRVRWIGSWEG